MPVRPALLALASALPLMLPCGAAQAQDTPPAAFDAALAARVGADERGMRPYVFVLLRTGPNRMPAGPERDAMFKGHFANINRLAAEGKLALAGPYDGADGWRGLFVLATADVEEARRLVATDPVVSSGEMTPEFHRWWGSAALMVVNETHTRVARKPF